MYCVKGEITMIAKNWNVNFNNCMCIQCNGKINK